MCDKKLSVEMCVCNCFIRYFQYNAVNMDREHVLGMNERNGTNNRWKFTSEKSCLNL